MRRRPIPFRITGPLVWIAFLSVMPAGIARADDDLTPMSVLGYGCWVQELAAAAADSVPSRLYPLGLSPRARTIHVRVELTGPCALSSLAPSSLRPTRRGDAPPVGARPSTRRCRPCAGRRQARRALRSGW